ncbi:hypothetical protein M440DRAFT_265570 [Trichoderma longibrachiatum ATCC 18648]|uniref:Uncharacterized protein n=1 Tax=Trichoderma longibrachiatum ATCC 18648 TaxID=983965 RepID=A0A2T4CAL2_TRILO|nr:hypothetical protein M440DRAFT_265570 [Trichoderma longibrachiatum ATCC 18648]
MEECSFKLESAYQSIVVVVKPHRERERRAVRRGEGSSDQEPTSSKGRGSLAQASGESLSLLQYLQPHETASRRDSRAGRFDSLVHTCSTSRKNSSRHVSLNELRTSTEVSALQHGRNSPGDVDTVGNYRVSLRVDVKAYRSARVVASLSTNCEAEG